jgi:hypothetical protein
MPNLKFFSFTKVYLFLAILIFCCSLKTFAQDTPKVEVFGGYSYIKRDATNIDRINTHGWNASVTANVNNWLGVVADASGHYGSISIFNESHHTHTFLFGPQFAYRKSEKIMPFAHALFGVSNNPPRVLVAIINSAQAAITTQESIGGIGQGISVIEGNNNAFTMAFGGGIDLKISKSVAVRLLQADYLITKLDPTIPAFGGTRRDPRLSTGLVLRFGKKD